MPPGGRRPGAGKPKGNKAPHTLDKLAARELVRQMVTAQMQPLLDAQIANAKGLKYLVTRDKKTGKFVRVGEAMAKMSGEETIEVWEKDPSVHAFTDLMDRALDKAKAQEVEVKLTLADELLSRLDRGRLRIAEREK